MTIIFYDDKLNIISDAPTIAPLSVIITDSSDTVPECQLIVSDEYEKMIKYNGYFVIIGSEKVYQITDITAEYGTATQYTVTGKEVTALIFSRRIALYDFMDATEQMYVENWIKTMFAEDGGIYPRFTDTTGTTASVVFNVWTTPAYTCTEIWEQGESLFDYVIKEMDSHKCAVKYSSNIKTNSSGMPYLNISVSLSEPTATAKHFLPDDSIESVEVALSEKEFTELSYTSTYYPYGTSDSLTHTARLTADADIVPYESTGTIKAGYGINITQQDAGSMTLDNMTIDSVMHYLGLPSWTPSTKSNRNYIYVYPNDGDNFTFYVASMQTFWAIKDFFEGHVNGYYTTQTLHCDWANTGTIPGYSGALPIKELVNGYYLYKVKIYASGTGTATTSGAVCIADTPNTVDPSKQPKYLFPVSLAALDMKTVRKLPKASEAPYTKTIDVTFTDTATANLGDKLIIHAGSTIVSGIVSSVTKTYEAGTETTDIEVKEWEAV